MQGHQDAVERRVAHSRLPSTNLGVAGVSTLAPSAQDGIVLERTAVHRHGTVRASDRLENRG